MKRAIFVVACVAGLSLFALAQPVEAKKRNKVKNSGLGAPPIEYPDVPLDSWHYQVLDALVKTKPIEANILEPMTKYEVAVIVMRLLESMHMPIYTKVPQQDSDKIKAFVEAKAQNLSPSLDAAAVTDGVTALRQECAADLKRLEARAYEIVERR